MFAEQKCIETEKQKQKIFTFFLKECRKNTYPFIVNLQSKQLFCGSETMRYR